MQSGDWMGRLAFWAAQGGWRLGVTVVAGMAISFFGLVGLIKIGMLVFE